MAQMTAVEKDSPSKGWVRDGILSFLVRGPGTATEISRDLGVSKATVSYHTKALLRKDMIEIMDIKSIRGGVYSKTYSLKRGGLALVARKGKREKSMTEIEEWFERLLMAWHLDLTRKPSDEVEIFLYHLFRILAESDSLDEQTFEEFGGRVGNLLISPSLKAATLKPRMKKLADYLGDEGMAQVTADLRKGEEPRLICMGCFQNKDHGSLVCSFTKGMLAGALGAKGRWRPHLEWLKKDGPEAECLFAVRPRGAKP